MRKIADSASKFHEHAKSALYTIGALLLILLLVSNTFSGILRSIWADVGNNWLYTYTWLLQRSSGFQLAVWGNAVLHLLTYWPLCLVYCFIELKYPGMLKRFKIQAEVAPTVADYIKCAKQVVFNQIFVSAPVILVHHYLMVLRTNGEYTETSSWPSFTTFVLHFAAFLLVEEILFYYSHRIAHWGPIYRFVHKRHHEFRAPVAMSAIYCHPLEHLFCNLIPVHAGPLLCGSHLSVAAVWYTMAVLNTINAHSGYHLPLFPSPEAHDYHHLTFTQNFGVLGILDYLHGTDAEFRASEQFKKHVMLFPASLAPVHIASIQVQERETVQSVKCK